MRQIAGSGVVAIILVMVAVTRSYAEPPPSDNAIDIQLFNYAIGPKTFFSVDNGSVAERHQLSVDALVTFLSKPFTIYNTTGTGTPMLGTTRSQVVSSLTAAQFAAAYGIADGFQIGASVPFVFSLVGDGFDPATGMRSADAVHVTGLGDALVEGKARLWRNQSLQLAAILGVSLPSSVGSDGSRFLGDDLPTLHGRLAMHWSSGRLSLGADAGAIVRKPRTIYATTIGQQLTWGAGAAVRASDRIAVIAETFGRTGVPSFSLDSSPIEAIGGFRIAASKSLAVVIGGGGGLDRAFGSPNLRLFASVSFAPDGHSSDNEAIGRIENARTSDDRDGDHRPDSEDKCPDQAEDLDGFEDEDGCPELDNDKDGIPDLNDKCPLDPEDGKQPNPKDGCPANKRDSDGDGIPDAADACPVEEEDNDGFEDSDGCPDLDNDHDGVPDASDKCPLCPEDKDGFQDDDGCPDLDNDRDGIPDSKDACPNQPETVNGIKDDDGCPDSGGAELVTLDGDRLDVARMPSLDGHLSPAGVAIVHQMALVMAGHAEVAKWLVALSLPGQRDAQKLGAAIKAQLLAQGVGNVDVVAVAGPPKIGGVARERSEADAPVCPATLEVKPRPANAVKENAAPAGKPAPQGR